MKKLKITLFVMTFVSAISLFAQTSNIEGIDFQDQLSINNETFVLNGGGLREKLGFLDLYVGGLYLSAKSSDANQIVMNGSPMAIRIVIASRLVSRERFIEALEEGFKNTTVGKYTPMQIQSFKEYLSDPFEIDDEIILVYSSKDKSTYLYKNSEIRGEFSGLPFKQALFGIWLGDKPAQESLKKEMLGFKSLFSLSYKLSKYNLVTFSIIQLLPNFKIDKILGDRHKFTFWTFLAVFG